MKPMSRKTLLRILLAISLYASGNATAGWYCLPKKYKSHHRFFSQMMIAVHRYGVQVMARQIENLRLFTPGSSKIGEIVFIKKPPRYIA